MSYDCTSRLTAFNGLAYGYGDSGPGDAVDRIAGADRLEAILGSPEEVLHWFRRPSGLCRLFEPKALACATGTDVEFYDSLFKGDPATEEYVSRVTGTAVHEAAHVIQFFVCLEDPVLCSELLTVSGKNRLSFMSQSTAGQTSSSSGPRR